jgi:sec-independent protein translocase protein TatC
MSNGVPEPEDLFAGTRMSFGDHLEDLRSHLWRAIQGFGIALVVSFFIGHIVLAWITAPVKSQLRVFYNHRVQETLQKLQSDPELQKSNQRTEFVPLLFDKAQIDAVVKGKPTGEVNAIEKPRLEQPGEKPNDERGLLDRAAEWLGLGAKKPAADGPPPRVIQEGEYYRLWVAHEKPLEELGLMREALAIVGDFDTMTTLKVEETFLVWFKVCLVCGFVLGSPWIFWQLWSFIAAGLYPHEKRWVHVYLPISLLLFLSGVLVCQFLVIPQAIQALLWFNGWMGYKPDLRLNEWLGFAVFMPVVFGLSFQTPLVMLFLNRMGVVSAASFRNKRRYFWFGMAVFAAVITPSTDALSMLFLWVPMSLLFELGIWLSQFRPAQPPREMDLQEAEELIEV